MGTKCKVNIYEYLDYRKYLVDYFRYKKSMNRFFSHRLFASKAGLTSCGYFSEVASGVRNLSKNKIAHFAKGLELDDRAAAYFERLVAFNHAKSDLARKKLYEEIIKALPARAQHLKRSQ